MHVESFGKSFWYNSVASIFKYLLPDHLSHFIIRVPVATGPPLPAINYSEKDKEGQTIELQYIPPLIRQAVE